MSLIDGSDGARAVVRVEAAVTCPRCAAGKGCGAGLFGSDSGARQVEASIRPGVEIAVSDEVEIALAPDSLLRAALIVYGLPMLGAVVGAAAAFAMSLGDAAAAMAAIVGLACGLALGRWRLGKAACLREFLPMVEGRVVAGGGSQA